MHVFCLVLSFRFPVCYCVIRVSRDFIQCKTYLQVCVGRNEDRADEEKHGSLWLSRWWCCCFGFVLRQQVVVVCVFEHLTKTQLSMNTNKIQPNDLSVNGSLYHQNQVSLRGPGVPNKQMGDRSLVHLMLRNRNPNWSPKAAPSASEGHANNVMHLDLPNSKVWWLTQWKDLGVQIAMKTRLICL